MGDAARKERTVPYKEKAPFDYSPYLRKGKLPHLWCSGCGHGIVLKSLIRAIDATELTNDDIAMVSGIGCSSRTTGYVDFNTMHTIHGRAPAFATGIKLANPKLKVIVATGDGDALAIGGNHFIHACRRNMDMLILVYNNFIYGMTSGQGSPTMPKDNISTTSKYGSIEPPFDVCDMAKTSGATFVARATAYHAQELEKTLYEGLMHKGTAVIDIIDACPTYFGRFNKFKSPSDMMDRIEKGNTIPVAQAEKSPEKAEGKQVRGIIHRSERLEYCDGYQSLVDRVKD
jgi:2-oxoglutarate ferredoxin oxidoreductase subunit beta